MQETQYFVDFMRDAPEPTGDETEEVDMELPKVYEPVQSFDDLQERLTMFLTQYNDMIRGHGMDLVFFQDAVEHLIKVSLKLQIIYQYVLKKNSKFRFHEFSDIRAAMSCWWEWAVPANSHSPN